MEWMALIAVTPNVLIQWVLMVTRKRRTQGRMALLSVRLCTWRGHEYDFLNSLMNNWTSDRMNGQKRHIKGQMSEWVNERTGQPTETHLLDILLSNSNLNRLGANKFRPTFYFSGSCSGRLSFKSNFGDTFLFKSPSTQNNCAYCYFTWMWKLMFVQCLTLEGCFLWPSATYTSLMWKQYYFNEGEGKAVILIHLTRKLSFMWKKTHHTQIIIQSRLYYLLKQVWRGYFKKWNSIKVFTG